MLRELQTKKLQVVNVNISEFLYGRKAEILQLLNTYTEIQSAEELYQLYYQKEAFFML